jgi:immunoglobulin-binding protein 1
MMNEEMTSTSANAASATQNEGSLSEIYASTIATMESEPGKAIDVLSKIQHQISMQALFSSRNTSSETIDDIPTSSLPFLTLEHHLGMAYIQLPTNGVADILIRQSNLRKACDLFNSFLQRLESYDILTKEDQTQFQSLVELNDHILSRDVGNDDTPVLPPVVNRDTKIARYRYKQQQQMEHERLQSLRQRRARLNLASPDDVMDGYDEETLRRTLELTALEIAKTTCFEEWTSTLQELPMVARMVKEQAEHQGDDRYHEMSGGTTDARQHHPIQVPDGPLQMTQVTQDALTGQLLFRRQDIRAQTFRPSWNMPTLTLDEFAQREVADALDREQRQAESEVYQKTQPRRYEQLVKDGMEDDPDLVDASAELDRAWDAFKDENPKGSGNKRGDVGDRNF